MRHPVNFLTGRELTAVFPFRPLAPATALRTNPSWKVLDDGAYRRFASTLSALVGERAKNAKINEANTEAEIILPLLNLLGWENAYASPDAS